MPALLRLSSDPRIVIEAVVTQPDRPRGRGQQVAGSAVKDAALEAGLHVYQPEKIKSDSAYEFMTRVAPDAVVIIAYGQIIPARLLDIPRLGWINLHASLLPRYRGAAPINWAILHGETRTGLTTMRIDAGLDTGPVLLQQELEIGPDETAPQLAARMSEAGAPLMLETLVKLARGEIAPVPQDQTQASFAPLLKKEHGRINWTHNARRIYDRIRALDPWPGAYTSFRGQICHLWGRPHSADRAPAEALPAGSLRVHKGELVVACGGGEWLLVTEAQVEGRKRLPAKEFVHGARLAAGEQFRD